MSLRTNNKHNNSPTTIVSHNSPKEKKKEEEEILLCAQSYITMAHPYARPHRGPLARALTRKPWLDAAKVAFRDDALLVGPPSCTAADFKKPRLRRRPFDPADLRFEARLGGGLDGYVWKVHFGDQAPFALKVVSDESTMRARSSTCPCSLLPPVLGLRTDRLPLSLLRPAARVPEFRPAPDDGGCRGGGNRRVAPNPRHRQADLSGARPAQPSGLLR